MYSYLLIDKVDWNHANYDVGTFRFLTVPCQLYQYKRYKNDRILIIFRHDKMLAIKQITLELSCQSMKYLSATAPTLPLLMKEINKGGLT